MTRQSSIKSDRILTATWLRASVAAGECFDDIGRGAALRVLFWCGVVASLSCAVPDPLRATGTDAVAVPPADPAHCLAAISADDGDKIISACGALIDMKRRRRPMHRTAPST